MKQCRRLLQKSISLQVLKTIDSKLEKNCMNFRDREGLSFALETLKFLPAKQAILKRKISIWNSKMKQLGSKL